MNAARYEPIIVTALRRYVRRGASEALLRRLAGGRRDWRVLNQVWELDGKAPPARCDLSELELVGSVRLGEHERRIALEQVACDCVETGALFPRLVDLAAYFGVSRQTIDNDLRVLRTAGAVDGCAASDGKTPRRRMVRVYPQGGFCTRAGFGVAGWSA